MICQGETERLVRRLIPWTHGDAELARELLDVADHAKSGVGRGLACLILGEVALFGGALDEAEKLLTEAEKLLLEAAFSQFFSNWSPTAPGGALDYEPFIPVQERSLAGGVPVPNMVYHGYAGLNNNHQTHNIWRASASYVTGTHSMKAGYQAAYEVTDIFGDFASHGLQYRFNAGVPDQITQRITPWRQPWPPTAGNSIGEKIRSMSLSERPLTSASAPLVRAKSCGSDFASFGGTRTSCGDGARSSNVPSISSSSAH